MNTIPKYDGPLRIITAIISKVKMKGKENAEIAFSERGRYQKGDPWMTVSLGEEYTEETWPPQVGDVITVIIPKVIAIKR